MTALLARYNLKPRDVTFALLVTLVANLYGFSTGGEMPSWSMYLGGSAVLVVGLLLCVNQMRKILVRAKNLVEAFDFDAGDED